MQDSGSQRHAGARSGEKAGDGRVLGRVSYGCWAGLAQFTGSGPASVTEHCHHRRTVLLYPGQQVVSAADFRGPLPSLYPDQRREGKGRSSPSLTQLRTPR